MLPPEQRKAFYTPAEVAGLARVDPKTVLNWIHGGRLSAVQLSPRVYRVALAAVAKLLYPDEVKRRRIHRVHRGPIPTPGYKDRVPVPERLSTRTVKRAARAG